MRLDLGNRVKMTLELKNYLWNILPDGSQGILWRLRGPLWLCLKEWYGGVIMAYLRDSHEI